MEVLKIVGLLFYFAWFAAALSYFLNFALGLAALTTNANSAIFSKYTRFLAVRRLKREANEDLPLLENDFAALVTTAQRFFTWEKAAGMCATCTNFWVSCFVYLVACLIFGTLELSLKMLIFNGLAVVLGSHTILRKYYFGQTF